MVTAMASWSQASGVHGRPASSVAHLGQLSACLAGGGSLLLLPHLLPCSNRFCSGQAC